MTLTDVVTSWLTTESKLHHFRLSRRGSGSWIICDCIDHAWAEYPSILIREDCVDIVTSWTVEHMLAADPDFFLKLHSQLAELCREANGYIN